MPPQDGSADVTEANAGIAALGESQQLLSSALWGTQAACWSSDLEADTTEFTDNFFSMTGIDRAAWEADIEPWCTWVHADDGPMGCARYRAHLAGATEAYEHEYRIRTPRGWMWLMDRGKVVERDASGRPRRIAGTTIDISARKALERKLIEALNREQRRLSHGLHDGLAQSLTGISLTISGIAAQLHNGHAHLKSQVDDVIVALRIAIDDALGLVRGILPSSIERGEIAPALYSVARDVSRDGRMNVRCHMLGCESLALSAERAQHVYAIAQQALLAALEESHATEALLRLTVEGDALCLVITHNGFTPPIAATGAADLNFTLMTYRAQALGGAVGVEHAHATDDRTQLTLRCPIARPVDSTSTYVCARSFCDCIPLHERNVHLRQESFP